MMAPEMMACESVWPAEYRESFGIEAIGFPRSHPVFEDASSQVLLQPRLGRSAYERQKHCNFHPGSFAACRCYPDRRSAGRLKNQIAARRAGLAHPPAT